MKKSAAPLSWLLLAMAVVTMLAGCTPPGPRALLDGERLIKEGKYKEAVEKLKLATQLLPTNAQSWNHLGLAYHGLNEVEKAQEAYQKALGINPDLESVRFNLGVLYLQMDRAEDAARELTSFVVMRPTAVEGWTKLGSAQIRLNLWEEAARTYTRAYSLSPRSPEVLNGLGLIQMRRHQLQDARRFFQAALEEQEKFPPALLNLAVLKHEYEGDKQGALQLYREYLMIEPRPPKRGEVEQIVARLYKELNPGSETMLVSRGTNRPAATPNALTFASITNRLAAPAPAVTNVATVITNVPTRTNQLAALTEPISTAPPAPVRTNAPPVTKVIPPTGNPTLGELQLASAITGTTTPPPTPPDFVEPDRTSPPPFELAMPATPSKAVETASTTVETPTTPEPEPTPEPTPEPVAPPTPPVATITPANPAPTFTAAAPATSETPVSREEYERRLSEVSSPAPPVVETPEAEQRPGFFQRMNPANLFRGRDRDTRATPLPGSEAALVTLATTPEPAMSVPLPVRTPAPEPALTPVDQLLYPIPFGSLPQYNFRRPGRPASGDRAKAEPHFQRGVQLHRAGSLPEAIVAYQTALVADPSYFEACYNLGLAAYRLRRLDVALNALEQALALQPDSATARFNFARALELSGYYVDAATEYQNLLRLNPADEQAHLAIAHLYAEKLGDERRAAAHYRHVLALNPSHPQSAAIRSWLARR